ncbi:MAG: RpiB/LacA/LacB family sugar-phosphate isomerase [Malacoplasma sp.]|nr:RpiB/LacA/LacB family sugar-phosphate isomerase [Malacoplasma sp.]
MSNFNNFVGNKIIVYIGCDHGGYEMKEQLLCNKELNTFIDFHDVGTYSPNSVDYPDYAKKIGEMVNANPGSYGIGICGTGIGISISLNKIKGIYAAKVDSVNEAKLAKEHNNVNTLALSGRFVSLAQNVEIIKAFFGSTFEGDRHNKRIEKIKKLEDNN